MMHSRGVAAGGHPHQVQKSSPTFPAHQQLAPPLRTLRVVGVICFITVCDNVNMYAPWPGPLQCFLVSTPGQ